MAKKLSFRAVFLIVAILIAVGAIYMITTENITTFGPTGASSSNKATTPTTTPTASKPASAPAAQEIEVKDTLPESFSISMYLDATSAGVSRTMQTRMTFNGHEVTSWTRSAVWEYPDGTMKYCDEKLNAAGQFEKTRFEGMDASEAQACYNFLENLSGDTERDKLVTGMALGRIAPKSSCKLPSVCYELK